MEETMEEMVIEWMKKMVVAETEWMETTVVGVGKKPEVEKEMGGKKMAEMEERMVETEKTV
jgi:hypothetical protein